MCIINPFHYINLVLLATFESNGEMEIFLNNISLDANIVKMLIESKNKEYLTCSEQFIESYKLEKINNRIKKIS